MNISTKMYLFSAMLLVSAALCTAAETCNESAALGTTESAAPVTIGYECNDEKDMILNEHNYFRRMVVPIASNMVKLEWDDELCKDALNLAGQCRISTYPAGYSLTTLPSDGINYKNAIHKWFNERTNYTYANNMCINASGNVDNDKLACRGYLQLVSATTYTVGCGSFQCSMPQTNGGMKNVQFYVCKYSPSANLNSKPYEKGTQSCMHCPDDRPKCVCKLCAGSTPSVQLPFFGILSLGLISLAMW